MNDRQTHYAQQSSSFLTGFSFGIFVGAAGYYLYATDRGKKLREHIVSEWDTAKQQLAREGVIQKPDISLREFIQEVLNKMMGRTPEAAEEEEHTLLASRRPTRHLPRQRREPIQRFKGV